MRPLVAHCHHGQGRLCCQTGCRAEAHMRVYASHRRPQSMPLGRLLIGVANATQQRFPEVLADKLQTQR